MLTVEQMLDVGEGDSSNRRDEAEMGRVFFGNFDFEDELADPQRRSSDRRALRRNAELAWSWVAMAQPGDRILGIQVDDPELIHGLRAIGVDGIEWCESLNALGSEFVPVVWGASKQQLSRVRSAGLHCDQPNPEVTARVNSRQFAHRLGQAWGCGLPGSRVVSSESEVSDAIAAASRHTGTWVGKTEFGMAGRGLRHGNSHQPDGPTRKWIKRKLSARQVIVFEPWVECEYELSFQFDVLPCPSFPEFLGVTRLLTNSHGVHRGNYCGADSDSLDAPVLLEALAIARDAATLIAGEGYFGPLGIDCLVYRDSQGQTASHAVSDINARFTMGRLAWELGRRLGADRYGALLHENWSRSADPSQWWRAMCAALPKRVEAIRCSPFSFGGSPVQLGVYLLVSEDPVALQQWTNRMDERTAPWHGAESA